jgi:hypothetical protein
MHAEIILDDPALGQNPPGVALVLCLEQTIGLHSCILLVALGYGAAL